MFTARIVMLVAAALLMSPSSLAQEASDTAGSPVRLLGIKKLCVDKFVGEESLAAQAREMVIAGLFASNQFVLTENCEKADAMLKGAVFESKEQRVRAEGESMEFGKAVGAASASLGSGTAAIGAAKGGSSETLVSAETLSQASVVLRIVDNGGEIIWAHTEDAKGGKVKSATALALDRAIKRLLREIEKNRRAKPPLGSATAQPPREPLPVRLRL